MAKKTANNPKGAGRPPRPRGTPQDEAARTHKKIGTGAQSGTVRAVLSPQEVLGLTQSVQMNPTAAFHAAIRKVRDGGGPDLLEHFIRVALVDNTVLVACMNKLIPNKHQVSIGPEELEKVVERIVFVCVKHVKDPTIMRDIRLDIENLARDGFHNLPSEMGARLKLEMQRLGGVGGVGGVGGNGHG